MLSVAIDLFVVVGWALSLIWVALLLFWVVRALREGRGASQEIVLAVCVPVLVLAAAHPVKVHIDENLQSVLNNSKAGLPKDKNDLLTNPRFGMSRLSASRVLFYGNSEKGAIVVLRSFPFNLLEFNLVDGTQKVRPYD